MVNGAIHHGVHDVCITCPQFSTSPIPVCTYWFYAPQVIIFDPQYDAYIPLCIANGGVPKVVKLDPSDWSVPHDQLAAAFNDKTKLILINSPHNPTGKVFSVEDLQFISDLCKQWGAYAVLDEVS